MAPTNNQSPFKLNLPMYQNMSQWGGVAPVPTAASINTPVNPANFSLTGSAQQGSLGIDTERYSLAPEVGFGGELGLGGDKGPPDKEGGWIKYGNFGLDAARVGLGVYNALEQSKMNKFMRGYYGDQMALQKTDFANAAKSTNEALAARQGRILSAQGKITGTEENRAGVASYMDQWGVKETI